MTRLPIAGFLGGLSRARRWALAAFVCGIAALAGTAALVLGESPRKLVSISAPGAKAVGPEGANVLTTSSGHHTACQAGEVLPGGVSAMRVSLWGFLGSRVHVVAFQDGRVLTEGSHDANWTSDSVTVPLRPLRHSASNVVVCVAIGPSSEPVYLLGSSTPKTVAAVLAGGGIKRPHGVRADGQPLNGRLVIEYLAPGNRSWWSQLLPVARRMGLGRAYSGTWIALLVALMMAGVAFLAIRLSMQELE